MRTYDSRSECWMHVALRGGEHIVHYAVGQCHIVDLGNQLERNTLTP